LEAFFVLGLFCESPFIKTGFSRLMLGFEVCIQRKAWILAGLEAHRAGVSQRRARLRRMVVERDGMTANESEIRAAVALLQNWLMGLGRVFVLIGGAVAAVASPLSLNKGSWLAAYLVLVAGA